MINANMQDNNQTCIDMKQQALTYLNSPSAALQVFTVLQTSTGPYGAYVVGNRDIRICERAPEDMALTIMHEGSGHGWFNGQLGWGLQSAHTFTRSHLDNCWIE